MGQKEQQCALRRLQEIVDCKRRHLDELEKLCVLFKQDIAALSPGERAIVRETLNEGDNLKALGCEDIPEVDHGPKIEAWIADKHYEFVETIDDSHYKSVESCNSKLLIAASLPDGRLWYSPLVGLVEAKPGRSNAEDKLLQMLRDRLKLFYKSELLADGWVELHTNKIQSEMKSEGRYIGSIVTPKGVRTSVECHAEQGTPYQDVRNELVRLLKLKMIEWYEGYEQYKRVCC